MSDHILNSESQITNIPYLELQRHLLAEIATKENIPSGILHRCILYSGRIRDFNGDADCPVCSQSVWEEIYHELVFSRHHGFSLLPLEFLEKRAMGYVKKGLTPVMVADFNFEIVRPRFWAATEKHLAKKLSANTFPLVDYPVDQILESRGAFFATTFVKTDYEVLTALPRVHYGLIVSFIFPQDGYFSNHSTEMTDVEVDFGLGDGYQPIQLDKPLAIEYSEEGT